MAMTRDDEFWQLQEQVRKCERWIRAQEKALDELRTAIGKMMMQAEGKSHDVDDDEDTVPGFDLCASPVGVEVSVIRSIEEEPKDVYDLAAKIILDGFYVKP